MTPLIPTRERAGPTERLYHGKYPGLVVDRVPSNDDGQHRGELRVQVAGILEEDPAGAPGAQRALETVARPCFHPGFFFIPEVGDQVWVEFAAGDIDSPIWTGVWYPVDRVPMTVDGELPTEDQKVIRTPTGQVLQLEDTAGEERIVVADETNGNTVTMDADGILLEDGNGHRVVMNADGILLEDASGNRVALSGSGIELREAGGTTGILLESSALTLETAMASLSLSGMDIELTNSVHALAMAATGTTLTDIATSPQPIALGPVVDWLMTHQHLGNMGAPAPLFPADIATILLHQNLTGKSSL